MSAHYLLYVFAALGGGYFGYMVVGHGLPWVWAKLKSIFGSAKADVAALEARVKALEGKVATVVAPTGVTGAH